VISRHAQAGEARALVGYSLKMGRRAPRVLASSGGARNPGHAEGGPSRLFGTTGDAPTGPQLRRVQQSRSEGSRCANPPILTELMTNCQNWGKPDRVLSGFAYNFSVAE
jgi:hypothetical protein